MIQGFRKFRDFALDELAFVESLERRLTSRAVRHNRQLYRYAGPNHDVKVWRLFVYGGHFGAAEDELARMAAFPEAAKVVAIS